VPPSCTPFLYTTLFRSVVTHDDDRTKRIADNSGANTIGMSEQGVADAVKTAFKKKGDELRNKLQNIGFDENQAKQYEAELDKGRSEEHTSELQSRFDLV